MPGMIRTLAALAVLASCGSVARAETRFLSTLDDVPLAPALVEQTTQGFAFLSETGRIIEADAVGLTAEGAVRAYYRAALPALGWSMERDDQAGLFFARGRERLTLAFQHGSDGALAVRYRIVARASSLALD
jgi:hypothetical protein